MTTEPCKCFNGGSPGDAYGLVHQDGRRFVWLVSERDGPLVVRPRLPAGSRLVPLGGGDPVEEVELAPYGVTVLQLTTDR